MALAKDHIIRDQSVYFQSHLDLCHYVISFCTVIAELSLNLDKKLTAHSEEH